MRVSPFDKLISFNEVSGTPKYLQLVHSILKAIENKKLQLNDMVPSINELSYQYGIARDTAEKGYKQLKAMGIVGAVMGKGYYVKSTHIKRSSKIFLLFNKLSPHKKIIYDAFVRVLGNAAAIDFYIYNNDISLFKKLLDRCKENCHCYDYYVILPHFVEGEEAMAANIINTLPKEKLILLDKQMAGVSGNYGAVYENFEKDIHQALEQALPQLSKYQTLKIIVPKHSYPLEIVKGFISFCRKYAFHYEVIDDIKMATIDKGSVYINLVDDDLVVLIERIRELGFAVGKDIGIISYNETPLKRIILNGLTTISTDFEIMGAKTARLILDNNVKQIEIPFYLTLRSSL